MFEGKSCNDINAPFSWNNNDAQKGRNFDAFEQKYYKIVSEFLYDAVISNLVLY